MPDAPPKTTKVWTLRKGVRWCVGGVEITVRETVAVEVPADVRVERVKPDRHSPGDAA
jgi:hypothetical protein